MLTCDHNQLSCTVPHGQQWLVANSQAFISISGKKKRISFVPVLQITSKQTTIYGTYLSAWQFFVWTGFDFHPHPRPPQATQSYENCKHIDKMTTKGNINSFSLTASCKTSCARAWYLFAMEMTVPPLVFEVTQACLNETKWWERTITIAHWNKRFCNSVERNRWRRCLSECPLLGFDTDISLFGSLFLFLRLLWFSPL